jgi:hypothetical protein
MLNMCMSEHAYINTTVGRSTNSDGSSIHRLFYSVYDTQGNLAVYTTDKRIARQYHRRLYPEQYT